MTTQFVDIAQRAAADGQMTADELLALRREGWGDGIITRAEAEALLPSTMRSKSAALNGATSSSRRLANSCSTPPRRVCNAALRRPNG
jgi:hypothetical protein